MSILSNETPNKVAAHSAIMYALYMALCLVESVAAENETKTIENESRIQFWRELEKESEMVLTTEREN